jgi:hypothetical protein
VTFSRTGTYTASLALAGATAGGGRSFTGKLDSTGASVHSLPKVPVSPLTILLQHDSASGTVTGQILGTDATIESYTSGFTLDRIIPAGADKGRHTLIIFPDSTSTDPQGHGFATINLPAAGNVTVSGHMADGSVLSAGAHLHEGGSFPLYAGLYSGAARTRGSVRGVVYLGVLSSYEWFKPSRPADLYYPGGFTIDGIALTGIYIPPPKGTRLLDLNPGADNGLVVFGNTSVTGLMPTFTLRTNNTAQVTKPLTTLTFNVATGLFSGRFINPVDKHSTAFSGAASLATDDFLGYYLDDAGHMSGSVEVREH